MSFEETIFRLGFLGGYFFACFIALFISVILTTLQKDKFNKFLAETKQLDKFNDWKKKK